VVSPTTGPFLFHGRNIGIAPLLIEGGQASACRK
jgi:hypothetical protein